MFRLVMVLFCFKQAFPIASLDLDFLLHLACDIEFDYLWPQSKVNSNKSDVQTRFFTFDFELGPTTLSNNRNLF